jgi:predicted outer membrane repeat protein
MWFSSLMRNPKRSGSVERRRTHGSPGKRFTFRPQLEALEDRWMPSILTVTTPGDPVDSYGIPSPGSLRYEIAAAQNGDTINFASTLSGQTITLSLNELFIDKNLNIQGLGASNLAISGDGLRVFQVASNVQVTLSGMTIENGDGIPTGLLYGGSSSDGLGGGILNYGTLTVSNCSVSGNRAQLQGGGIYNAGTLTVTNCSVSGNKVTYLGSSIDGGGGIFNRGTMTLSGCSVTNNSTVSVTNNSAAGLGGGIFNAGTMTILSSTVTSNSGGGIFNDTTGNLTITNKSLVCNNFDPSGVEDDLYNLGTVKISMSKVCGFSGNNK